MKAVAALVLAVALSAAALAQATGGAGEPARHDSAHAAEAAPAEGEVRRVDRKARKITIRHGPIPHLDMPAMTMVFQVKDPALLDQVKVGDRVNFTAEKIGGAYTLTSIESAKR